MTKIDETTGLALLPEDMFWRIEEAELKFGYTTVNTIRLCLMQNRTYVTKAYSESSMEKVQNGFWKHFFTGDKFEEVLTITEVPEKSEETVHSCTTNTLASRSEDPEDRRGWTQYTVVNHYSDKKKIGYFKVEEPTAENIAKLSVELLKDWIDGRHEIAIRHDKQHAIDKITGDYPPKSLKDMETV